MVQWLESSFFTKINVSTTLVYQIIVMKYIAIVKNLCAKFRLARNSMQGSSYARILESSDARVFFRWLSGKLKKNY